MSKLALISMLLVASIGCATTEATTDANTASETESATAAKAGALDIADKTKQLSLVKADPAYGEYLGAECLTCHQPRSTSGSIPVIHGRAASEIIAALLEYKFQVRENTTMTNMAQGMSDEDIAALAIYFSSAGE